jgi:vitamin B12 transport system permease protein
MSARRLLGLVFALICTVMIGLAAGAIWLVPTIFMGRLMPWLALPVGWLLGRIVRGWVNPNGRGVAAALAGIAMIVASAYLVLLVAGARIAGSLGVGFFDTLRVAGIGLLCDIARLTLTGGDVAWYAAGTLLAMAAALRARRTATPPSPKP